MAFLTVRDGNGRRIYEVEAQAVIGRGMEADVLLDDLRASKKHAEVRNVSGRFLLNDLNSTNGTLLDGQPVQSEVSLQDGDEFSIGETTIVFTRNLPPGAESAFARLKALDAGAGAKPGEEKSGLVLPEKGLGRIRAGPW